MSRVLIVAQASVVRAGLEAILGDAPGLQVVGTSATSSDLADQVESLQPDVILAAPGGPLSETLSASKEGLPALVLLTDDSDGAAALDALRYGARAVLPRDAQPEEIVAAVQAAASGLTVLTVETSAPLLPYLSGIGRADSVNQGEALTPREVEVLSMLAEGAGNKIIARRMGISEHTVKFHVGSIMGKLNAASRTEAVTVGIRRGLILL
ncbi:MAG TPA: DNA-binding response regulator [Chloroflexi bacterium]|nr:DNA-binding response regulator [Chloroflexota bacterium]